MLITPVVEVDGRDRMVDLYRYRKANPGKPAPGLVYWGKYVAHDNNRDGMGMALALSKVMMNTFLEWHPQVLHDLHESVPFLYISTGTGPYNAWLDPIVVNEWQQLAYHEVEEMTKRGVPGVWTHGFYDGWAPNYMFYVANGHNAIGRFYETFGNGGADTRERTVPDSSTSAHLVPPQPAAAQGEVVAAQQRQPAAERPAARAEVRGRQPRGVPEQLLPQVEAVGRQGAGPKVPPPGSSSTTASALPWPRSSPTCCSARGPRSTASIARSTVKVARPAPPRERAGANAVRRDRRRQPRPRTRAAKPEASGPAGSYVVRMDQPYSRMVDMMLDTQYYSTADPRPYDDTGWTLGPLRNVATLRVTDPSILDAPMTLVDVRRSARGGCRGERLGLVRAQRQRRAGAGHAPLPAEGCRVSSPPKSRSRPRASSSTPARS